MLLRLATLLLATPAYASFVTSGGVGCATRASRASAACMCDAAEPLLDVRELKASAEGTSILKGVNLQVRYARGWPCERGGRELTPPPPPCATGAPRRGSRHHGPKRFE